MPAQRPTSISARERASLAGLRRIVNQLYANDGALVVETVEGSSIGLADTSGEPVSAAEILRTLQLMLQEQRTTNLLLAQLKEPGGYTLPAESLVMTQ